MSTTDPKLVARITCITVSCSINVILLFITFRKIYIQKEKQPNLCLKLLIIYLILGFFTPFYNIIYRYVITPNECFLSDTIEEGLVIITRGIVLLFYIIRLKAIFEGSFGEISDRILKTLIVTMVLYSVIIPASWIPQQEVTAYEIPGFGVYCSNSGKMYIIVIYYVCDFAFTLALTWLYVYRLYILSSNSIEVENKSLILKKVVGKTIYLTSISVVSTWIIMYPSYLSSSDFLSELRWFYPLDYGINGLCLFWMFKWKFNCVVDRNKHEQTNNSNKSGDKDISMGKIAKVTMDIPAGAISTSISMQNLDIENTGDFDTSPRLCVPTLDSIAVHSNSMTEMTEIQSASPTISKAFRSINGEPLSSDNENLLRLNLNYMIFYGN